MVDAEKQAEYLESFREFHRRYGRWPLPIDAREYGEGLPTPNAVTRHVGGWQALWDLLAGLMPRGGPAIAAYRKSPNPPSFIASDEPAAPSEDGSFTAAAARFEAAAAAAAEAREDLDAALHRLRDAAHMLGIEITYLETKIQD